MGCFRKRIINKYALVVLFIIVVIYWIILSVSPINVLPSVELIINNDLNFIEYIPIFDNRANLLRSCLITTYYDFLKPSYRQPYLTNNICYIHVHKCGGTMIMNLFKYLYSNNYIKYLYHPKDFYEWMFDLKSHNNNNIILFTYVRDPIHRFISGFYEMKRRNNEMNRMNKTNDIIEIRTLLSSMIKLKQQNKFPWNVNKHLWPQLLFLIDKYGKLLNFNYIGLLDNINITLPIIIQKYEKVSSNIVINYLNNNLRNNSRSRQHDPMYAYDDYITVHDLTQHDIYMIHQVYWLDYQCLFPEL